MREVYDQPGNRAAISMKKPELSAAVDMIFNYNTSEFFAVFHDEPTTTCSVSDIQDSPFKFLFGFVLKNGKPSILTAANVLKFTGDFPQQFIGNDTVRGIAVNHWRSCAYDEDTMATTKIDWYWSDPVSWQPSIGEGMSVPVRCVVEGKIRVDATYSRPFKTVYDYFNFQPMIDEENLNMFLTPRGVQCVGRKFTKPMFKPPSAFSMSVEELQINLQYIDTKRERFDSKAKLFRIDYMPTPLSNSPYGMTQLTEIHDYNTGVAYVMDPMIGNCTVNKIASNNPDAESVQSNPSLVRIRTAEEFFYTDHTEYTYEGVRMVRGVPCDVFIATRTDFPKGISDLINVTSTFEWFISTKDYTFGEESKIESGIPMRLQITTPDMPFNYIYEIFDFDTDQPSLFSYDVSQCYTARNRRHFEFALPGDFNNVVSVNKLLFRYSVLASLTGTMAVTPVRISNLQVDFDESNILVTFTLLDTAPIKGDTQMEVKETPLDLAAQLLNQTINQREFKVIMIVDTTDDPVVLTAKPYSVKEVIREVVPVVMETGYTAGSMAGLAIAMTLVGLLGGILAAWFYLR
ncbi:uncharacterized protein LOC141904127 isoform X2 [Tubulanus polymorphus]|uniref:uncharacterized protein LOC141904127 isoform X2 n=1 Tax=Tubulanus polymorphus TaxID=672921 RepID=UPI003DA2BC3D